ncbi:hypothetical protein C8R44DRAFT_891700 [Mycena epipterygia]|nr:hypothetical protein C8R44DRAFT_891700 [Mycena epipterygia]
MLALIVFHSALQCPRCQPAALTALLQRICPFEKNDRPPERSIFVARSKAEKERVRAGSAAAAGAFSFLPYSFSEGLHRDHVIVPSVALDDFYTNSEFALSILNFIRRSARVATASGGDDRSPWPYVGILEGLIRIVRPTGSLGILGLYVSSDPGASDAASAK